MRNFLFFCLVGLLGGCPGGDETVDMTPGSTADLAMMPGLEDLAPPADAATFSFSETFPVADGSPWPSRWTVLGGVAAQSVQGNRGRLIPTSGPYALARMGTTAGVRDMDVTFQLQFDNFGAQGIGFYVRQNGGYLRVSATHGQGYAVYIEGNRGARIGVWREIDGQEQEILTYQAFATPPQSNMLYSVRFRCTQMSATATRLQARMWPAAQSEPTTWQVDTTDATPALQNIAGGMAVDSYSPQSSGTINVATFVGNIYAVAAN